jgi:hypothetical protein
MDRRQFLGTAASAGLAAAVPFAANAQPQQRPRAKSAASVMGLRRAPMERVRFGMVGVGARGSGHVNDLLKLDGVEVTAVADLYPDWAERAANACTKAGRPAPALYHSSPEAYRRLLEREDVDAVVVSTPWEDHAKMALAALQAGKHCFVEVPFAVNVDELWQIVDAAERTQLHCMMLENVCYGREELLVLHMCRLGVFGELLHGEAAYIHDLRGQMHEVERGTGSWRTEHYRRRNGNLYPTHGLGPVAQYMGINRGDRFDFLSSVSSNARVREAYARANFPADHKWNQGKFVCGDINTTIVRTVMGRTILVQWDEQLPRPYNRLNLIQGTKGVWGGFPDRCVVEGRSPSTHSWQQGESLEEWHSRYEHPLWKRVGELAKGSGHGGMDFVMWWRAVQCLREGLPLDQDVYDGAAWTAVGCLSEVSVANRGRSVDVPDFTRGEWKSASPLGIVGA